MPEANVLFVVAAVVIAALAGWVAVVLKTAKEPWVRTGVVLKAEERPADPPLIGEAKDEKEARASDDAAEKAETTDDADEAKDAKGAKDDTADADADAKKDEDKDEKKAAETKEA